MVKVSNKEKERFIKELLSKDLIKRRECVWILNYIIHNNNFLDYIHFTEKVQYCPKGLFINVKGVQGFGCVFYNQGIQTADAEKAFHDLRFNLRDKVHYYIEINFQKQELNLEYLNVLEENPYLPEHLRTNYTNDTEKLVDYMLKKHRLKQVQKHIDISLDINDKERFISLTQDYNTLLEELNNERV